MLLVIDVEVRALIDMAWPFLAHIA